MKVLITGGAGFIGSHLADRLLANGCRVLVIDNFATARRDNLVCHPNLNIAECSVAESTRIEAHFNEFRPDVVVHAAASYKNPDDWLSDALTNTAGTVNVVKAAKQVDVRRFIYLQTALCYGLHPLEQPVTLDHPIRPAPNSYAITKTAGEQYVQISGLDFLSFRLANVYGPRNISGPLPTFYSRLVSNKPCYVMDTRRDFIFIDDMIDLLVMALNGKGDSGIYHVSSGCDYAIRDLYELTLKVLGKEQNQQVEVRLRNPEDAYTILLDFSKTVRNFEWRTTTSLEKGVTETIKWYQRFGVAETYTHLKPVEEKK